MEPLSCLSVTLVYCRKTFRWTSRCHLVLRHRPMPRRHCVRWGTAFPHLWPMSTGTKRSPISATAELLFWEPEASDVCVDQHGAINS